MGSQAGNLSTTRSMLTTHLSCIMSTTLLLLCLLVSFSFLVAAAPQRGLIGPQKFSEEESDMISAVTTCQTAILRCCTPDTPTTNATWRCFEKNSCGGLFVVHSNDTRTNIALGACAFLSKVKDLIDEEDNVDSLVSERNVGRPKLDSEDTNGNLDESSQTTHSLESEEDLSKNQAQLGKIFRNPPTTNRLPFASKGCLGGSHERCIKDAEEGGCGALEQFDLQSYIKCVHHCVEHCKTEAENLVERK